MNKIIFNELECTLTSFNKNTYFSEGNMSGSISCSILVDDMDALIALGRAVITTIQIMHDDERIYNLTDTNITIDNINEYLSDDHMDINLSLSIH